MAQKATTKLYSQTGPTPGAQPGDGGAESGNVRPRKRGGDGAVDIGFGWSTNSLARARGIAAAVDRPAGLSVTRRRALLESRPTTLHDPASVTAVPRSLEGACLYGAPLDWRQPDRATAAPQTLRCVAVQLPVYDRAAGGQTPDRGRRDARPSLRTGSDPVLDDSGRRTTRDRRRHGRAPARRCIVTRNAPEPRAGQGRRPRHGLSLARARSSRSSTPTSCRRRASARARATCFADRSRHGAGAGGQLNRGASADSRAQPRCSDALPARARTRGRARGVPFPSFNGTAGLWRRACIEEAGGWSHDTLTGTST